METGPSSARIDHWGWPGTGTVDRGHMSLIDHPSSVLSFDLTSPAALGVE